MRGAFSLRDFFHCATLRFANALGASVGVQVRKCKCEKFQFTSAQSKGASSQMQVHCNRRIEHVSVNRSREDASPSRRVASSCRACGSRRN
jgi:hypothetical protein